MDKVKFTYETKLDSITPKRIKMYLNDYQEQVHQLDELAADWNFLNEEERSQYQCEFDIALGRRHILQLLYKAKKLTPSVEIQFAKIEQELFDKSHIAKTFGYLLMTWNIFPLNQFQQSSSLRLSKYLCEVDKNEEDRCCTYYTDNSD